jgi:hypothetical protein
MPVLYQLAILGLPNESQLEELQRCVSDAVEAFGIALGREVEWHVGSDKFDPKQSRAAAAVYFGRSGAIEDANLERLRHNAVPIIPVVSSLQCVHDEIPETLRPLNCLEYDQGGAQRVATALLECCGLLPRQRRVFVSYKRSEARAAAVQLFDELSSKVFDVFWTLMAFRLQQSSRARCGIDYAIPTCW